MITRSSERWTVRTAQVENIVQQLHVEYPVLDMFADRKNHRFVEWWGPGGRIQDAFTQDWGGVSLKWCNPPYSMLTEVVDKLIADKAYVILIAPRWKRDNLGGIRSSHM